jgi:16S rRNA (cytosine1402-N4)-methyltransferase
MSQEVSQFLVGNQNGLYIDASFGGGGHSRYLIEKYKNIKIIAMDCDENAFEQFKKKEKFFDNRVLFIKDNFKNIKKALSNINVEKVDGILADLGVSSRQLDDMDRGFSFNSTVLDMRMDLRNPISAKDVINSFGENELADIFYKYGQERFSRQIAKAIAERRKRGKINSSLELGDIIRLVKKRDGKIDPATKVFQALRIFVNDELSNLKELLDSAPFLLNSGGRIAIISFHSLEDRIVKLNFKDRALENVYKILTKKIIVPADEEIRNNPRSRSAKLRAAQKI